MPCLLSDRCFYSQAVGSADGRGAADLVPLLGQSLSEEARLRPIMTGGDTDDFPGLKVPSLVNFWAIAFGETVD